MSANALRCARALAGSLLAAAVLTPAASAWQPEPARYGVGSRTRRAAHRFLTSFD